MKKYIVGVFVLGLFCVNANAAMSYECSFEASGGGIAHGSYVKVSANSKEEAERKARAKIKEIRGSNAVITYLRCK
jgi:hypothetical protein